MSFPKLHISKWLFLLGIGAGLLNSQRGHAQQLPQYEINVNEGLLQASVYAIHQDAQGFMWLGTGNGLNRFDGLRFRDFTYRLQDTSSRNFPGKIVHGGFITGSPAQLFFLVDGNLVAMNTTTERFRVVRKGGYILGTSYLIGFLEGNLWLVKDGHLERVDTASGAMQLVKAPAPEGGISLLSNAFFYLRNDSLWQYKAGRGFFLSTPLPAGITASIKWTSEELLLANADSLYLYNVAKKTLRGFPKVAKGKPGQLRPLTDRSALLTDADCQAWVVFEESGQLRSKRLQREGGRPEGCNLTVALRDRSGGIWLSQESGGLRIYTLTENMFRNWQPPEGPGGENLMAKSIYNTPQGLLTGTFSRGMYLTDFTNGTFQKISLPAGTETQINSFIKPDHLGRLWSNAGGQLLQINLPKKQAVPIGSTFELAGKPRGQNAIYSFCEVAPDRYWVGTFRGVWEMHQSADGQFHKEPLFPQTPLLQGFIYALEKAPEGDLYVGKSAGGFVRLQRDAAGKCTVIDHGLAATTIRHFHFDTLHHLVWMATDAGVVAYNPATKGYQVLDDRAGLRNKTVYAVLSTNNQRFWLSTNGGLSALDAQFKGRQLTGSRFTAYTVKDGLQSNEFNTGAYHNSGDSLFFFGGLEGVNQLRPASPLYNALPPPVQLVEVRVNNVALEDDTATHARRYLPLSYKQNNLSFQFAALDFLRPGANEFSFFLEGYDDAWQHAGTVAEARYHSLPAGHYTLWLRASNNDKVWSQPAKKLHIFIQPPFWETVLFKTAVVLSALLLVFLLLRNLVRRRVQRRLREWEKLQAVNEERNRIHRDMHDDLGSGLSRISLLSELAAQKLAQSGGAPARVQQIAQIARGLTEKMGAIIWMLQPKNDTLDALAAYLQEYLYRIGEEMGVETEVHFPEGVPATPIQNAQRRCVLLVTQEAINNALKYAEASTLSLSLLLPAEKKGAFVFTFRDNGKGFDANALPERAGGGNGLKNMQERLEQMGGYFHLQTASGAGCKIVYGWK